MDGGGDGASPRRPTLAEARAAMFARQEAAATQHVSFFLIVPIGLWPWLVSVSAGANKQCLLPLQPFETGSGSDLIPSADETNPEKLDPLRCQAEEQRAEAAALQERRRAAAAAKLADFRAAQRAADAAEDASWAQLTAEK